MVAGPVIFIFYYCSVCDTMADQPPRLWRGDCQYTRDISNHSLWDYSHCLSPLLPLPSVTLAGPIGWIGLVIPNMIRVLVGSESSLCDPKQCPSRGRLSSSHGYHCTNCSPQLRYQSEFLLHFSECRHLFFFLRNHHRGRCSCRLR